MGTSNEVISDETIRYIYENHEKIDIVMIAWTEWTRLGFSGTRTLNPMHVVSGLYEAKKENPDPSYLARIKTDGHYISEFDLGYKDLAKWAVNCWTENSFWQENIVRHNWTQMLKVAFICEALNIKYIFTQLLCPISVHRMLEIQNVDKSFLGKLKSEFSKCVIKMQTQYPMNPNHHIGFPFFDEIGGFFLSSEFPKETRQDYQIGPLDGHPNHKGHEFIAEYFLRAHKEVYG